MKIVSLLLLSLLIVAGPLNGQSADSADSERNRLWIFDYKNLPLVIESLPSNSAGLTREAIQTRTELRLRSAGIKPTSGLGPYLYVNVNVAGPAFSVDVSFRRSVVLVLPDQSIDTTLAATWNVGTTGTHGHDASYILAAVDHLLDKFLNEYLKANQE